MSVAGRLRARALRWPFAAACAVLLNLALAAGTPANASPSTDARLPSPDPADAVVGIWLVESRDAAVQIEKDGDEYRGRLAWLLHPNYGVEDGPLLNGKPAVDNQNPDPALRSRTLLGLPLLWGLHYVAETISWDDGRVYNTQNGQSYHCRVWMDGPDHLKLRGYLGVEFLGHTTTWTRTALPPPVSPAN